MNPDIRKVIYAALFGASGPVASWLIAKGVPADQTGPLLTACQTILSTLTPILATSFLALMQTLKAKIAAAHALPDADKIAVAASVPQVQQIVVSDHATDGVATAAADINQPKVMTASDAAKN